MAGAKQLAGAQDKQRVVALAQANRLEEARALCAGICKKNKKDSEAWFLLGAIHGHMQNFVEAAECCRRAVKLEPRAAMGHFNLGVALHKTHHYADAIASFRKTIRLQPDFVEAHLALANLLAEQNQLPEAESAFRSVLKLNPNHVEALGNLGNLLQKTGAYEEAVSCYRAAIAVRPDIAEAHFGLGNALRSMDAPDDALASYNKAIELRPDLAPAYNNKGLVYLEQGAPDEAITLFRRSLEAEPSQAEARINLSTALRDSGDYSGAMVPLQEILKNSPDHPQAHGDLSLLYLQTGNFSQGWQEYEWRLKGKTTFTRAFPQPGWKGESLDGKTILVHAEQGVGDEIMFASCIPDLVTRSGHVVIDCDERLAPLFQRSFPAATAHGGPKTSDFEWLSDVPAIDVQIPAGSLPLYLRPGIDDYPEHSGYLVPDPGKLERWRERFRELGAGLKVGISWRGGHVTKSRIRSTSLMRWQEILTVHGIHFVNLQYGDCESELSEVKDALGIEVHDWDDADPLKDLDNFAAQISALDLVISIDNSTVHMAGALGIPVWTLQPFIADWRWLVGRDDSYWYPVMRHFKQPETKDWSPVFSTVRSELSSLAGTG